MTSSPIKGRNAKSAQAGDIPSFPNKRHDGMMLMMAIKTNGISCTKALSPPNTGLACPAASAVAATNANRIMNARLSMTGDPLLFVLAQAPISSNVFAPLAVEGRFASVIVVDEITFHAQKCTVHAELPGGVIVGGVIDFTPDYDAYIATLDTFQRHPHPVVWVFRYCWRCKHQQSGENGYPHVVLHAQHHGLGVLGHRVGPHTNGTASPSWIRIAPTSRPLDFNMPQSRP